MREDYIGMKVPDVVFKVRVRDESIEGPNPFRWQENTTADYFAGKRVILFSLPGAFTPTCSTFQLPNFENLYDEFVEEHGIDEIYCMAVNDAFVMNAWAKHQNINKIKCIPDGNGFFTAGLRMLVDKFNLGFGCRSWRYSAIINDGIIEEWFEEPGMEDNCDIDPYGVSSPENVIKYLRSKTVENER
jgi:peroxiredoxin